MIERHHQLDYLDLIDNVIGAITHQQAVVSVRFPTAIIKTRGALRADRDYIKRAYVASHSASG
ncbi:hypothetical protein F5Y01DRAFT_291342 [Xylaria sp. FL0043]|nr:hypothetical protein F5Y01DRAFT_291342 [Xylaria sp. FL0043]